MHEHLYRCDFSCTFKGGMYYEERNKGCLCDSDRGFQGPGLETIISVIGDSNVVLSTICKVFYAFAIGAAIVKGLAKVNEFIHPNKKTHMKNACKAMRAHSWCSQVGNHFVEYHWC